MLKVKRTNKQLSQEAPNAEAFFAQPSKLSSGTKNRRFGGNKFHTSHLARCTHESSVFG